MEANLHGDKARPVTTELSIETLARSWGNDPNVLHAFFEVCVRNWKEYSDRKPGKLIPQVHGTFLQATKGDYVDKSGESLEEATRDETPAYEEWRRLKGTDATTAKRQFITLLREFDKRLLLIKAKPPGFNMTTPDKRPICPWSNTQRGCPLPLISRDGKTPLTHIIDTHVQQLKDAAYFRRWVHEHEDHGCTLGAHMPLEPLDIRAYRPWFEEGIRGGYKPYTLTMYHRLVRSALDRQASLCDAMMAESTKYMYKEVEAEVTALLSMMKVYREYTGEEYTYEVPCTRTTHHCNQRRGNDKHNHTHPMALSLANGEFSTAVYEKVVEVREQCRAVGLSLHTGVCNDPERRLQILQDRLATYYRQLATCEEARLRLRRRASERAKLRRVIPSTARAHMDERLRELIVKGDVEGVSRNLKLGGDQYREAPGGVTPLIRAVLLIDVAAVKALVTEQKVDVNHFNSHGMSAVSWAVKLGEPLILDTLLDIGGDAGLEGSNGMTPFMLAVRFNCTEMVEMILGNVFRDAKQGAKGVDRVLNHQNHQGISALILAAGHRNFAMIRLLLKKNADRFLRDKNGRTAEAHARRAGWKDIGEFLKTTRAVGPAGTYTAWDDQHEREIAAVCTKLADHLKTNGVRDRIETPPDAMDEGSISTMATASAEESRAGAWESAITITEPATGEMFLQHQSSLVSTTGGRHLTTRASRAHEQIQAAEEGRSSEVLKLIRTGLVAPDFETQDGSTCLICAAHGGDVWLIRALLSEGAEIDYTNRSGKTALMAAAANGQWDAAVELLSRGANASLEDVEGRTCNVYAGDAGFSDLAKFLNHVKECGLSEALLEREREMRRLECERDEQERRTVLEGYGLSNRAACEDKTLSYQWRLEPEQHVHRLRCWKCTLFVPGPCKHFKTLAALRASISDAAVAWRWHRQPKGYWQGERLKNAKRTRTSDEPKDPMYGALPWSQSWSSGAGTVVGGSQTRAAQASYTSPMTSPQRHSASDGPIVAPSCDDADCGEGVLVAPQDVNVHVNDSDAEKKEVAWRSGVPLRWQYAHVRNMLVGKHRATTPRDITPSNFLLTLSKVQGPIADLFLHGCLPPDIASIASKDIKILLLRSMRANLTDTNAQSHASGFLTVDLRHSVCLFPRCGRCAIGFAKVADRLSMTPLCDACILIQAAPKTCDHAGADHGVGDAEEKANVMPERKSFILVRQPPMTLEEAISQTESSLRNAPATTKHDSKVNAASPITSPARRRSLAAPYDPSARGAVISTLRRELIRSMSPPQRVETEQRRADHCRGEEAGVYTRSNNLEFADYLIARRRGDVAEGVVLKALGDHIDEYGTTHVSIALVLRSMAQLEESRGCAALARAYRETSFEILVTQFGPIHQETVYAAKLLARSLLAQGRGADAVRFYEEVAKQLKRSHLRHFRDVAAMVLDGRGKVEEVQRQREEVEKQLNREE